MTLYTLIMLIAGIGSAGLLLGAAGVHLLYRRQLRRLVKQRKAEQELTEAAIGSAELAELVRRLQDGGHVRIDELVWLVTATGVFIVTIVVWQALERGLL